MIIELTQLFGEKPPFCPFGHLSPQWGQEKESAVLRRNYLIINAILKNSFDVETK